MDQTHLLTLKLVLFVKKTNNYNTFETGAIFNVWTELQATLRQGKHRSRTVWFCLVKLGRATKRGSNI